MLPNQEIYLDIATELRTKEAYVEKDYHITRLLHKLSELDISPCSFVFGGGTSLLKGYSLISRFSEDIDFLLSYDSSLHLSRPDRRQIRKNIISFVDSIDGFEIINESLLVRDSSQFFSCSIRYPRMYADDAMRPEIKLECSFKSNSLSEQYYEEREINSIVSEYVPGTKSYSLKCLSPVITASDKISAFTWRTLTDQNADDSKHIRHLYDLHFLLGALSSSAAEIINNAKEIYKKDHPRGIIESSDLSKSSTQLINVLSTQPRHKAAYNKYVIAMCFGQKSHPSFEEVFDTLSTFLQRLH